MVMATYLAKTIVRTPHQGQPGEEMDISTKEELVVAVGSATQQQWSIASRESCLINQPKREINLKQRSAFFFTINGQKINILSFACHNIFVTTTSLF